MTPRGFVYIMTNQSMPNQLKVGKTRKVPTERAKELDTTGVPTPFEVQYYAFFDDMDEAEKRAHSKLSNYHHGKEFFKVDVPTAINAIESTGIAFQKLFSKPEDDKLAEQIRKKLETEERRREKQLKQRNEIQKRRDEEIKRNRDETHSHNQIIIKRTIVANNENLKFFSIVSMIGASMLFLVFNVFNKGGYAMLLFWGGVIFLVAGVGPLLQELKIRKILSACPNCKAIRSILKASENPTEIYRCIECSATFDFSDKK